MVYEGCSVLGDFIALSGATAGLTNSARERRNDMANRNPRKPGADSREKYWRQVLDFEQATWIPPFDTLVKMGIELPSPEKLTEAQLSAKLWEVIEALAFLGVYLEHTDHLSDRELYTQLWQEELREAALILPDDPDSAWHIDFVGSGSEEDSNLYLTYYADEEERQLWAEDCWDGPLPNPQQPLYDRDRDLPRPHSEVVLSEQ